MITFIQSVFRKLPAHIVACFSGTNILWHILAALITYVCVISGFDWFYFESTRNVLIEEAGLVPAIVGFLVPVIVPIALYIQGKKNNNPNSSWIASGVAQAEIIAWLISATYKAFTGRIQPELFTNNSLGDISREFHFGFLQHGVFWGWPSTHTTVAFAMAFALITFYPNSKSLKYVAVAYAFFIGLGVSVTIHWFSDFIAGAIIGTLTGSVVGKRFQKIQI